MLSTNHTDISKDAPENVISKDLPSSEAPSSTNHSEAAHEHSHSHEHPQNHTHDHSHSHEHSHTHSHEHPHSHSPEHTHENTPETQLMENSEDQLPETTHLHPHGHYHDPKEKKRQINRLSRIIGHLEHVKRMLENDEDCAGVLIQLSAAKSALNGLGKQIINDHIEHCIVHAVEDQDSAALDEFKQAIQKYLS